MKYYFGPETDSKTGNYKNKYQEDENGVKQPVFIQDVFDAEGNFIGTEETMTDTGAHAKYFDGDRFEGLMYSLVKSARDLVTGNLGSTPKIRKRRAMLAIHDLLVGMFLFALVRIWLEDFKSERKDKKDEDYIAQAKELAGEALYKATREYNPFDAVFNAFQWEPAFASMSATVGADFMAIMKGKGNLKDAVAQHMKMTEILPGFS